MTRCAAAVTVLVSVLAAMSTALGDLPLKAEQPKVDGSWWWTLNATRYADGVTWLAAADFLCTDSNAPIAGVEWWMASYGGATVDDITAFTVTVYDDDGSLPGDVRASYTVTSYDKSKISNVIWGYDNQGELYKFRAEFDTLLSQVAGAEYWVSVVANVDEVSSSPKQWRWVQGEHYGAWNAADRPDDGTRGWLSYAPQYQFDLSLNVLTVPVPGALVLGMLGLGLVGWVKRRMA